MHHPFDMPGALGTGMDPAFSAPVATAFVAKVGNGYTIQFHTNPKMPPPVRIRPVKSPFEGMDPDEIIDRMVDGVGALLRSVNDSGAGESWKESADRQQVREAFKVFFPDFAARAEQLTQTQEEQDTVELPRHESLVFEHKEELLAFLAKNL